MNPTSTVPGKFDINPTTNKQYGVNPATNVQDDNYWSNTVEPQLKAQYGGGSSGGAPVMPGQPAPLDLPDLYKTLYDQNGVGDLERGINNKTAAYNAAQATINDNPFLSEAKRVGRNQKLNTDFNNNIQTDQAALASKKADIETQVGLATKQFDINSQQVQQSMNQFNSLLSSGALDGASDADIANLTRSTGLSSSMIKSAISSNQAKNAPKPQIISFDDGTSQGYATINPQTGEILNKQVIAGSKILGTAQDKAATKTAGAAKAPSAAAQKSEALATLPSAFKDARMTLGTAMSFFQQYGLTPQQIYNQYKINGQYKPTPDQQKADQKRYNVK